MDVRVYANNGEKFVPTKKGLSCRVDLLPWLIGALQTAERRAEEEGLLS